MDPEDGLTRRQRRRLLARGLLRALATAVLLVTLYYVLPLDRISDVSVLVVLSVGFGVLAATVAWQVRAIVRADYPGIRATQALATTTSVFLLSLAAIYFLLSLDDPANFTERLSRSDAVYLAVTIFSTVGFGDISAQSETARLVATAQMLLDLVVLGFGVQLIVGAAKRGRADSRETRG